MGAVKNQMFTVSGNIAKTEQNEVDFEHAMDIVGVGRYNIMYCVLFALFLISAIIEVVGYSYILPAAKCDLDMEDSHRGLIASMPYMSIVVTSLPWGYLIDTRGRKPTIIISSFGVGIFGIAAAFMPNLISFVICKLLASLCLACPSAAPYAFIGEILPQKHRDFSLSVTNAMQVLGSTFIPLLAWLILPLDFRADFGLYEFRPWRLLTILYSGFFILCACLMCFCYESPKYLVSQGRNKEALDILRVMYARNHLKSPEEFPVKILKTENITSDNLHSQKFLSSLSTQTMPLFKPPYIKWIIFNGFLLFGIFASLNGLNMWIPDVLNRVFSGSTGEGMTACEVIGQRLNGTISENETCDDGIDVMTFKINSIANSAIVVITLLASLLLKIIGKKTLLLLMYFVLGSFCVAINFVRQEYVFAALLATIPITAVGIGPINAYNVQIFPTALRGMSVSVVFMLGRTGSIFGANIAGILIISACEANFYLFGGLLFLCGFLTLLLPKSTNDNNNKNNKC